MCPEARLPRGRRESESEPVWSTSGVMPLRALDIRPNWPGGGPCLGLEVESWGGSCPMGGQPNSKILPGLECPRTTRARVVRLVSAGGWPPAAQPVLHVHCTVYKIFTVGARANVRIWPHPCANFLTLRKCEEIVTCPTTNPGQWRCHPGSPHHTKNLRTLPGCPRK